MKLSQVTHFIPTCPHLSRSFSFGPIVGGLRIPIGSALEHTRLAFVSRHTSRLDNERWAIWKEAID